MAMRRDRESVHKPSPIIAFQCLYLNSFHSIPSLPPVPFSKYKYINPVVKLLYNQFKSDKMNLNLVESSNHIYHSLSVCCFDRYSFSLGYSNPFPWHGMALIFVYCTAQESCSIVRGLVSS